MGQRLDEIRLAVMRAPATARGVLFNVACKVLLPLSTMCKVCNMLRGMVMGVCIGAAFTAAVFFYFGGRF